MREIDLHKAKNCVFLTYALMLCICNICIKIFMSVKYDKIPRQLLTIPSCNGGTLHEK